jgi:hypothetical protein
VESVNAYYYDVEPATTIVTRVNRFLKLATCTEGPTITEQFDSNSAYMKKAEFVITCPDPWAYGQQVRIATLTDGVLGSHSSGVTMTAVTPGTYDLTCYAEDVSYVPTDANCGTIPKPPRPKPVDPCDPGAMNRGYLFFIPPTLLEELAGTYPIITFTHQATMPKGMQVRCAAAQGGRDAGRDPASAHLGLAADRRCPEQSEFHPQLRRPHRAHTNVGDRRVHPRLHPLRHPPPSTPATGGATVDQIPLVWPEMYGGNDGYFIYIEQNCSVAPDLTLDLETRR